MGIERNRPDSGGPEPPERNPRAERRDSGNKTWTPPPDNPGSPGQPSRIESRRASTRPPETGSQQPQDKPSGRDDAGQKKETGKETGRSTEKTAAPGSRESERQQPATTEKKTDRPGRREDGTGERSPAEAGPVRSAEGFVGITRAMSRERSHAPQAGEQKTGKPGEAPATGTRPESQSKPETPSSGNEEGTQVRPKPTQGTDGREAAIGKAEAAYAKAEQEFGPRHASRAFAQTYYAHLKEERQAAETGPAQTLDKPPGPGGAAAEAAPAEVVRQDGEPQDRSHPAADDQQPDDTTPPTEADRPETTDPGEAWREHVEEMEAKWDDLETRWTADRPAQEDGPGDGPPGTGPREDLADLPGDEPGSWRGDGGQYLNYEENYAVGRTFDRMRDRETDVTDALKRREAGVDDARLVGLEYRVKGEDRFKEKVAAQLAAEYREDPQRAAESMPDGLRYTYQISANKYTQGYREITEKLADDGYEMVFSRNSWDTPVYRGINTRWKTPDGQLFEVQFHTPESFEAKQMTHLAYERRRNPLVTDLEAEEMDNFQSEVSAGIPIPEGVSDIPNFRREDS